MLECEIQGMAALFLENENLRVGVLAGKGSDVFEFNYKPKDVDFIWLTPRGIQNPTGYLSTSSDPVATFLDCYLGGWQEILPNGGAPSTYLGARFGQHGEVCQLPWDYEITEDREEAVAVRLTVRTQKVPFCLEKELRLVAGESTLHLEETLINEGEARLDAMWGHHITLGPPFLREGCRIRVPDGVTALPHPEPIHPHGRRVKEVAHSWPIAQRPSGEAVDLSVLPPRGEISEMLYLTDFSAGWYEVHDRERGASLRVEWDLEVMPYLWFWQEFGASREYPWYGRSYTIGLEPFSSWPTSGLAAAVENGSALSIGPHEKLTFSLSASIGVESEI